MHSLTGALRGSGLAALCVALSTGLSLVLCAHTHVADLAMIHLLGIVFLSLRSSVRVSIVASLVSIALFDFFFIAPEFKFAWSDVESSLTFAGMFVVAAVVSTLSENLRQKEQEARAAAYRAEALREYNLELSSARDVRQLAAISSRHLRKLFQALVIISLQNADGTLETFEDQSPRSAARAHGAWLKREPVRAELGSGMEIWVPLVGIHSTLGVVGLEVPRRFERDSTQDRLLSACASQFATAIERVELAGAVQRTQLEAEGERLRSSLLSAVSHDLKTPLATMIAAGETLVARGGELSEPAARSLLVSMVREGERLSRLIQNLLSVARLEASRVELRRTPESIEDIVHSALEQFAGRAGAPEIDVDFDDDLPLVSAEPLLLEQVLVNLLENAARYAGPGANVSVGARHAGAAVSVEVADDGPGIAEHEREKVFEKFYRGAHTTKSDGGVGLGLTICRAIVRAHGGAIAVRERNGGGALVEFTVPLAAHGHEPATEVAFS
ncbi:MAG TPA: ATP-binding protein [Polyangiaceae bacterium]|nr:ATP-binding protein [Polyangiaceae bacterium]